MAASRASAGVDNSRQMPGILRHIDPEHDEDAGIGQQRQTSVETDSSILPTMITENELLETSPATGAVNNFFTLADSATAIEVVMTPSQGADGYHFYSLHSEFVDQPDGGQFLGGMYAGIQTNGINNGQAIGKMFIFSVWDAETTYPATGIISTPFYGEGTGYSLRRAYDWQVGRSYRVAIRRTVFDDQAAAYRWEAAITDLTTGGDFECRGDSRS